jgi:hypothetical protein
MESIGFVIQGNYWFDPHAWQMITDIESDGYLSLKIVGLEVGLLWGIANYCLVIQGSQLGWSTTEI